MSGQNLGFCSGSWSPIAASGPQSALSGVLAGFVFAGLVVVLSTTPSGPDSQTIKTSTARSYALQLLAASFIVFALDSYFTSITAGEQACNRADAEAILTGGILGTGAIMLVAGLSWLLATYSDRAEEVRLVLKAIVIGIWAIAIAMLALSGMDEGQALLPHRSQVFVDSAPYAIVAFASMIVVFIARKGKQQLDEKYLRPRVLRAALAAIGAALISGLATGIASAFSAHWWYRPPSFAVCVIVVLSMLIPLAGLLASVTAAMAAVRSERYSKGKNSWRDFLRLLDIGPRTAECPGDSVANLAQSTDEGRASESG